jgi:hypothetical protein
MITLPEIPRNAQRAQSEGRARQVERRGQGHYKGRSPVGPRTVTQQTSPLSARHIAGVRLAEKSGAQRTRDRYLWDFTLFTSPISRHPKSAYVSQGL